MCVYIKYVVPVGDERGANARDVCGGQKNRIEMPGVCPGNIKSRGTLVVSTVDATIHFLFFEESAIFSARIVGYFSVKQTPGFISLRNCELLSREESTPARVRDKDILNLSRWRLDVIRGGWENIFSFPAREMTAAFLR